jgi:hypothetical protein
LLLGMRAKDDALSAMFGDRSASPCRMMAWSLPPSSTSGPVTGASEDKPARICSAPSMRGQNSTGAEDMIGMREPPRPMRLILFLTARPFSRNFVVGQISLPLRLVAENYLALLFNG